MTSTAAHRVPISAVIHARSRDWAYFVIAASCFGVSLLLARGHLLASVGLLVIGSVTAFLLAAPFVPWRRSLIGLILVVLFIPIRRYVFPGSLPFQMEPYRLLVALMIALWLIALLVDPKVRTVRSNLGGPVAVILLGTVASIAANPDRVERYASNVAKSTMFFVSFFLVMILIVSVIRSWEDLESLVVWLAGGGVLLAILTIIEYRTGYSPFAHLDRIFPFLKKGTDVTGVELRGGHVRPEASAEHPIALAALLIILAPLTVYLAKTRSRLWGVGTAVMAVAAESSLSRTAVVMTITALLTLLWMRPLFTVKMLPYLLIVLVALKFVTPGAIGTLRYYFDPSNGLIANQSTDARSASQGGRLTDISPTFDQIDHDPLFGIGYGTRIRSGPQANGRILDDQWLGNLLDTGLLATLGWVWLFTRFLRLNGRAVRGDPSDRGLLIACLSASAAAFMLGMFLFDAFSFIQVTLVMFMLLGLGTIARQIYLRDSRRPASAMTA